MRETTRQVLPLERDERQLPRAWRDFIHYCRELRHGEIERLSIQDGVPVFAEVTTKKVRFTHEP